MRYLSVSILDAGFGYLVNPIMQEGGYVRYDNQRSKQIIRTCNTLQEEYDGSLNALHETAADETDLKTRITDFNGIGPVTANIFLRELRPIWQKSSPEPLDAVQETAARHNIDLEQYDQNSEEFTRIEAELIRYRNED